MNKKSKLPPHKISSNHWTRSFLRYVLLLLLLALTACATGPRVRVFNDFVVVRATDKDTLSSLAAGYLNDPEKAWQIAEFNGVTSVNSGQELVIPLIPFKRGGLKKDGYQTVPVLAYHDLSRNKPDKLTVSERAFKEQMRYLKENGYHALTLDQLLDFLDYNGQIPEKSVVITFDDGWRSVYDMAFPVLKGYGFPAALFIYTDFIGSANALSWDQIGELAKNGFDIQSKTLAHRDMTKLNKGESLRQYFKSIRMEISESKKIIEKKINRPCRYLAYPYGKANNLVIAVLKKMGYRAAFTQNGGSNPFFVNHYLIHRSVIQGEDNLEEFKGNLSVFCRSELK